MNARPEPGHFARARRDRAQGWVGHSVSAVDTPALVVDLGAMERNLARRGDFASSHGMRQRLALDLSAFRPPGAAGQGSLF